MPNRPQGQDHLSEHRQAVQHCPHLAYKGAHFPTHHKPLDDSPNPSAGYATTRDTSTNHAGCATPAR